jgi:hypothetical protein
MKTLILIVFLAGCQELGTRTERSASEPHAMACSLDLMPLSNDAVFRCENDEVVCYVGDGIETMALACRWKDQK